MAVDMSTWRSVASSRLSSFRGSLVQQDAQHTLRAASPNDKSFPPIWRLWGKKLVRNRGNDGIMSGVENISLFPGWATRRYRVSANVQDALQAFDVEIFISGYASSHKGPEFASRSQRAFTRLAKGFAAIPKLTAEAVNSSTLTLTPSTEDLLSSVKLPPRPTEITEDYEVQALEEQFRHIRPTDDEPEACSGPSSPVSCGSPTSSESSHDQKFPLKSPEPAPRSLFSSDLRRLNNNLESRLKPFWSTALSGRTIRVHVLPPPPLGSKARPNATCEDHGPLASQDVQTASNGYFQARFKIRWEDLCQHRGTLEIAFGPPTEEHDLLVVADLLPSQSPRSPGYLPSSYPLYERPQPFIDDRTPTATSTHLVSVTYSPVRLISDIDDTVKFSDILSGARAAFRNVFVKEFRDIMIPGMGEWYNQMWKRGVRFHYVSNGPFELLPVVIDFFQIAQLPRGSIRLRSYAGRSLFNGLMSAPATRKRAGVLEILQHFADSKFLLVGDTGEQDLELYSALAQERPWQVAGVFVRDVNTNALFNDGATAAGAIVDAIDDPTGSAVMGLGCTPPALEGTMTPAGASSCSTASSSRVPTPSVSVSPSDFSNGYFTTVPSPLSAEPENDDTTPLVAPRPPRRQGSVLRRQTSQSDPERKRQELQSRVWTARLRMPGEIPLRVFRSPEECVEAREILDRLLVWS